MTPFSKQNKKTTKLMMISYILQIVIVALLFNMGQTQTAVEGSGDVLATVHVRNGLPEEEEPKAMQLDCSSEDKIEIYQDLAVGDEYSWSVKVKEIYSCGSIWGNYVGSWDAFQPSRDANHTSVFWLVKRNGFFLSWDNSTWIRRYTWGFE
ncbi:hypothetical protein Ddye_019068 [Dipteronia dyeriana]|uniref:Plant self-incompatibility S1 n=1 Tax=Dipteronia dyeriana TaxID=168575 RepID=A0AAD9TXP3_9ROSI|nr:hypothetical protein Ddye_019068 [Dipteronia dyeriana]